MAFVSIVAVLLVATHAYAEICMQTKCTFELEIRQRRSMSYTDSQGFTYNVEWNSQAERLQIIANSFHQPIDLGPAFPSNASMIGTFLDQEDVITADGNTRNIFVINEQYPGPTLEVMEGSEVSVNIINHLHTEGVTIHFHGQHFQDNMWMDGVQYVTQCPILPGQSFEYKFIAKPAGTFFYHAHSSNMRIDGTFGGFIVHKQIPTLPYHVVMVQDFYHEDAATLRVTNPQHPEYRGTGESHIFPLNGDYTVDGNQVNALAYDSTLIDGRGRTDDGGLLPLATYTVAANSRYRFRVINSGSELFYDMMIDSHKLDIVALDGQEISPITVDSFVIAPGERVDFEVDTIVSLGRYWLRAEVLREGSLDATALPNAIVISDGIIQGTNAILSYEGVTDTSDPTSTRRVCTANDPCTIFNCPYQGVRTDQYTTCLTMNDAQSIETDAYLNDMYGIHDTDVVEYFLNWGNQAGPRVNGKVFASPFVPFSQDNSDRIIPCDETQCAATGCTCTHLLNIPFNKTIQLVLVNYFPNGAILSPHALHLHGHTFAVMTSGYPDFDPTTGLATIQNADVLCDSGLCYNATWNGPTPAFNTKPALKDTIVVPPRGYHVIRFRSNNPGYWAMHCHQERHSEEGMFMVFGEAVDLLPPVPNNFPTCGNFKFESDCPKSDSNAVFCPNGHTTQDLKYRPFNYFYTLKFSSNDDQWHSQNTKDAIIGSGKSVWMHNDACLKIKTGEEGTLKKICAKTKFADTVIFDYVSGGTRYRQSVFVEDNQVFTTSCFNCGLPLIEHVHRLKVCFSATRDVKLKGLETSMCTPP